MKKRILALALVCAVALTATACGGGSSSAGGAAGEEKQYHVVYSAVTTNLAPWPIEIAKNFEEMCKRNNWKYDVYDGEGNPQLQTEHIASIISDGEADLVVLFPAVSDVATQYVKDLTAAGIDVITLASDVSPDGQSMVKCYVGPDQYAMIKYGADYIINKFGKDSALNYVVLSGFEVQNDYQEREKAMNTSFADTNYNQLAINYCGASRDVAMEQMASYLITYDNIDFIFCFSDEFALGAIQALDQAGKTGQIPIVSAECFKESIPALKEGKMDLTVTMTGKNVVLKLEESIKALREGKTLDYYQASVIEPVTKDNADSVSPEY